MLAVPDARDTELYFINLSPRTSGILRSKIAQYLLSFKCI